MFRTTLVMAVGTLVLTSSLRATADSPTANSETISRFLQSDRPALTSYRARRHLEASTLGGKMKASLDAWTTLAPDGSFDFEIIKESGSDLIRGRVLRAALMEEQRARQAKELDAAALTPANYDLRAAGAIDQLLRIEVTPRRHSQMLIVGAVFVTPDDADLVRVEGSLAKRPSFWTKHVDIDRRYERIAGVRVPVEMRSRADVRIVGESTFAMTYEYATINGRPVDVKARRDELKGRLARLDGLEGHSFGMGSGQSGEIGFNHIPELLAEQ